MALGFVGLVHRDARRLTFGRSFAIEVARNRRRVDEEEEDGFRPSGNENNAA